jgi:hypothetical protein
MNFEPLNTFDNLGGHRHPDLPEWHKELIDQRLAIYHKDPTDTRDWDDVFKELTKEDEC